MTKEFYEALSVAELRQIAKNRGMKRVSALKKAGLVDAMLEQDRLDEAAKAAEDRARRARAAEERRARAEAAASEETAPARPQGTRQGRRVYTSTDAARPYRQNPSRNPEEARSAQSVPSKSLTSQARTSLSGEDKGQTVRPARREIVHKDEFNADLDSGLMADGILEVIPDGFGFIRSDNFLPGDNDIYVSPSQIRRFNMKTGDIIRGNIRVNTQGEKFAALLFVKSINGLKPEEATRRFNFEDMTPIFPNERIRLETPTSSIAMRVMDLLCPVGKGQRGMIVSPPKAGKTTLLKEVARSVKVNNPEIHLIILLIDERPEEVTDIKEAIEGPGVEVIYSTFDEQPERHKRVSEMVIERAKRLVEHKKDVMILLDSITRLTRAYNLTEPASGRTLSGGLDPAALYMPKRFFGAARNMREGGSLTILATALIDTGSKMDDVVYEEFKGTGNMEMVLDRRLSEKRIFPAIDIQKSSTRREDLLLSDHEMESVNAVRRSFNAGRAEESVNQVLELFARTRTNGEFISITRRRDWQ